MNRDDLATAVRRYLNRPNLPDTDITTMIGAVEGEFNRELRDHPRNARRTEYTIPTEDESGTPYEENTPILPLPVDLASLVSVFDSTGTYTQFPPLAVPARGYIERGDCLHIYPTPARGTIFSMDYVAFLRPLQAALDSNWISDYFSDLYLYGILKESAVYLKNDQRLNMWQQEFLRRLEGVRVQGWNQNIAASPRMRFV